MYSLSTATCSFSLRCSTARTSLLYSACALSQKDDFIPKAVSNLAAKADVMDSFP